MTLEMASGLLIVISIIFVLTLPFFYLLLRSLRAFLVLLKELKTDYKRIAAEMDAEEALHMEEKLIEYLQRQQEKQEIGLVQYYIKRLKYFLKHYGSWLYMILGAIACVSIIVSPLLSGLFSSSASIQNPKLVFLFLFPVELISCIFYWCCKTDKRKWQSGVVFIIVLVLGMLWEFAVQKTRMAFTSFFLILLMLFSVIYHYRRWKQDYNQKLLDLEKLLQENSFTNHELLKQYQHLREMRHDTKKHLSILQYLSQDAEIDAIQTYIDQLEGSKKGVLQNEQQEKLD